MFRSLLTAWQARRAAAATEALALLVGPHIAQDIGVAYPSPRPIVCLNPIR